MTACVASPIPAQLLKFEFVPSRSPESGADSGSATTTVESLGNIDEGCRDNNGGLPSAIAEPSAPFSTTSKSLETINLNPSAGSDAMDGRSSSAAFPAALDGRSPQAPRSQSPGTAPGKVEVSSLLDSTPNAHQSSAGSQARAEASAPVISAAETAVLPDDKAFAPSRNSLADTEVTTKPAPSDLRLFSYSSATEAETGAPGGQLSSTSTSTVTYAARSPLDPDSFPQPRLPGVDALVAGQAPKVEQHLPQYPIAPAPHYSGWQQESQPPAAFAAPGNFDPRQGPPTSFYGRPPQIPAVQPSAYPSMYPSQQLPQSWGYQRPPAGFMVAPPGYPPIAMAGLYPPQQNYYQGGPVQPPMVGNGYHIGQQQGYAPYGHMAPYQQQYGYQPNVPFAGQQQQPLQYPGQSGQQYTGQPNHGMSYGYNMQPAAAQQQLVSAQGSQTAPQSNAVKRSSSESEEDVPKRPYKRPQQKQPPPKLQEPSPKRKEPTSRAAPTPASAHAQPRHSPDSADKKSTGRITYAPAPRTPRSRYKKFSHPCPFCTRTFRSSSQLARHRRIHLDVKPFECWVQGCGARFCRIDNMVSILLSFYSFFEMKNADGWFFR